jgi:hypothetical protein
MAPTIAVERITPSMAKKLLEGNTNNRKVNAARVGRYAADMRDGRWQVTGEALKFNGSRLLDGQNRLLACIEANTPFRTVVIRDLEVDVMDVLDTGRPRSVADNLHIRGYGNVTQIAGAARLILMWRSGHINDLTWINRNVTPAHVTEFADQNIDVFTAMVNHAWAAHRRLKLNHVATLTFLAEATFSGYDDQAVEFMDAVVVGADLSRSDPRLALRNWAANTGQVRRNSHVHLHAIVTAWNAKAAGGDLKVIKPWFKTGMFPTLKAPTG